MPRLLWPSWRWITISGTPSCALDGVRVAELVGREAAPDAGRRGGPAKRRARGRAGPRPSPRVTVDDAEQRADGELEPASEPWLQLLPCPLVHADFAAPLALTAANEQRAAAVVEVGLVERESLANAQAGAPVHHDQAAQAAALRAVAGGAHDGDDLLDRGRVGGIAHAGDGALALRALPGSRPRP
jgi:hypothetical protein